MSNTQAEPTIFFEKAALFGAVLIEGYEGEVSVNAKGRRQRYAGADRAAAAKFIAAALILYHRSTNPVTGLLCPPEVLVARFAGAAPGGRRPPGPAWARALVARASQTVTGWLARG
jgi:hypothetical protein